MRDAKDLVTMKADAMSMNKITVDVRTMRTKCTATAMVTAITTILQRTQLITEISKGSPKTLKSLPRREAKTMRRSSFPGMVPIP